MRVSKQVCALRWQVSHDEACRLTPTSVLREQNKNLLDRTAPEGYRGFYGELPNYALMPRIYDRAWQAFRRRFLAQPENQRCSLCGRSIWWCRDHQGKLLPPNIDHKVKLAQGGAKYDSNNLQVMCWSCHSAKTRGEQTGNALKVRGSDQSGSPLDPKHPWHGS